MGKSTKVKVFLVVALVVAATFTTIGVMAYSGLFQSDRAEAMKLLLQASERLTWSAAEDYIGSEKMTREFLKEGGQLDVSISDLQPGDGLLKEALKGSDGPAAFFSASAGMAAGWDGISDYTLNWNKKVDIRSGRTSNAVSVANGAEKISFIRCQDEEEDWIALPELLEGKVFHVTAKEKDSMFGGHISGNDGTDVKDILSFIQDFEVFMIESSAKIQKDMSFDRFKRNELEYLWDAGYEAVIPKETVNAFLQDFTEILQKQEKEIFDQIAESTKDWSVAQDITLKIYGEKGRLGRLETAIPIAGEMCELSLDFTGEKGNSAITFFGRAKIDDKTVSLVIKKSDKSKDICESAVEMEMSEDETSLVHVSVSEQVSPDDGSYQMKIDWDDPEENKFSIRAKGSVKDLKKGSCVSYILDDVEFSEDGSKLFSLAVKYQLIAGGTEVVPPGGDMVEITSDTKDEEMEQYKVEIMENLRKILPRMGTLGNIFNDGGLL